MNIRRVALAVLLLLTACGGDDVGGDTGGDATTTTAEAAAPADPATGGPEAGAFPVTIEHALGETTIEAEPQRVVTVGILEQDALLALGIVPVGTTEWFGEHPGAIWPWAQDELEALGGETPTVLDNTDGVNAEAVAALRPDLILALYADLTEAEYDTLSAIAPTVAQPADTDAFGVSWQGLTRTVGEAVGRPAAADALVADVEARLAAVRDAHPEFAGASAVVATPYEGTWVYGPEDVRGRFLTDLGFVLPEGLAEATGDQFGGNISQERTDMVDVDVIVWLDPDDAEGPLGGPAYANLDVHTQAREVFIDSFGEDALGGATSFVTVLSLPFLLDGLVPKLAAAVDGDPATEVP